MEKNKFLVPTMALYIIVSFLFFIPGQSIRADGQATIYVVPTMTNDKILSDTSISPSYISDQISVKASPGEFEPASFVVKANQDINSLQVETTNLSGPGNISSDNVNIRVVKIWYQNGRDLLNPIYDKNIKILTPELLLKDDSLVNAQSNENYLKMLDGSYTWISKVSLSGELSTNVSIFTVQDSIALQPVNIAQNTNKQFWITLKVPSGTVAGNYTGQINLKVSGVIIKQLTLNLQVLPITLSDPSVAQSIYTYHQYQSSYPNGSIGGYAKSATQYAAEVKDLIEHGIKNPDMYQNYSLGTNSIAWSLQLRINGGMYLSGEPLYYAGMSSLIENAASNSKPIADFIAQDIPKFQSVINLAHSYGINEVYFYGIDEAKGALLLAERPYWQAIHNIGGKIFVACCCGCYEAVGDLLDLAIYPYSPVASEAAKWHSVGHKIGSYGNPQVGMEDPETYRRNYGLLLWQNDYDLAMDFIYQSGWVHIWNDFDGLHYRDFTISYPTINGVISTIQAEGWREAYDDLRYVTTLKNLVNQGGGNTSYAISYLNYLKTVNLQEKSLDLIRSELINQILYLLGQGPVPSFCGDNIVGSGEACDTNNFNGQSCSTFGYSGGNLSCNFNCAINKCACTPSNRSIAFISPTDPNGATIYRNWTTINTSLSGENCSLSSFINWDNSLVGYWKFDEGSGSIVNDSSGHGINGTLVNNPQWTSGKFGSALEFDGTAKYVQMPDSNYLDGLSAMTVEAWVYPDYNGGAKDNGILKDDWILLRASGWATLYLYDSAGNGSGYTGQVGLEDQNKWHHVAATYDSSQSGRNMKLYVDGKLESSKEFSGVLRNGGTGLRISMTAGSAAYWDGKIDEVKVWKRALSEDEIKASYNTGLYNLTNTFSNLIDGTTYQYYARTVDSANTVQTETRTLTFSTNPSPNQPPVLDPIGNKTVNEGATLQFTITATDPNGDSIVYSATGLPIGATFDTSNHTFNWTPTYSQSGSYPNICFQASDGTLSDSECITITVNDVSQNQPPVLDSIGNKTVNEGSALQFTITASDPNGDNLTYSASNLPPGAIFNAATHAFSWTPSYTQSGTYSNVCFQVSDGTFTDSECITITVNDSSQPCTNCSLGTPTVNPASPQQNQSFTITCPANAFGYDCITAYSNNNSCTYSSWSGSNVIFNCSGQTGGGYTAKCKSSPGTQSNCCSQEKTQSFTVQTPYIPPSPPSGGGGGGGAGAGGGGGGGSTPGVAETTTIQIGTSTVIVYTGGQPSTTTPMTIEQLKARLAQLLALLAQLQAQLAQLRGETIPQNYQFTKDLNLNQKDNDVKYLQIFLKNQGKDIYPEGLVTGYYGKLTYSALKNFQLKQGVITSVSDSETGIFKSKTRTKVNEMMKVK